MSSLCFQEDKSCQDRDGEEKVKAKLAWTEAGIVAPGDRRSRLLGWAQKGLRAHCKHIPRPPQRGRYVSPLTSVHTPAPCVHPPTHGFQAGLPAFHRVV